jgi:hypothetical protein
MKDHTLPVSGFTSPDAYTRDDEELEQGVLDQCGYCGGWFRPGPDDQEGVCYVHRPGYSDGALWDAGFGEDDE